MFGSGWAQWDWAIFFMTASQESFDNIPEVDVSNYRDLTPTRDRPRDPRQQPESGKGGKKGKGKAKPGAHEQVQMTREGCLGQAS